MPQTKDTRLSPEEQVGESSNEGFFSRSSGFLFSFMRGIGEEVLVMPGDSQDTSCKTPVEVIKCTLVELLHGATVTEGGLF